MSAALVKRESQAIGVSYSSDQLQLIKDIYAKGASDAEFRLFVEVSKYQGLDIFKKQIYLMKFWDSDKGGWGFQPVTGIDGYRSKAEDTGLYGGQLGPFWCGEDGEWKDVWTAKNPPVAAKVGIIRTDWQEPCWAVARYVSYVQTKKDGTPNKMWDKMPDNQLAKCAESLALRKAFPQQVGGLYTDVELEQAGEVVEKVVAGRQTELKAVTNPQVDAMAEVHANLQACWPQDKIENFGAWFAATAEGRTAEEVKSLFKGLKVAEIKAKLKDAAEIPVETAVIDVEAEPDAIDAEINAEISAALDAVESLRQQLIEHDMTAETVQSEIIRLLPKGVRDITECTPNQIDEIITGLNFKLRQIKK